MKINTINTFFFYVHEYYKALGRCTCSYKKKNNEENDLNKGIKITQLILIWIKIRSFTKMTVI